MTAKRKPLIATVKVGAGFVPTEDAYPYFHIRPLHMETGNRHCLYLHLSPARHLLLIASDSRYRIVNGWNAGCGQHPLPFWKRKDRKMAATDPCADKAVQIALAEAQILGFVHGRSGYTLVSLVASMGLTRPEWQTMQEGYPIAAYLSDQDVAEIEEALKAA